jgi:hypothetical protein
VSYVDPAPPTGPGAAPVTPVPTFSKVLFIIDLIFCILRIPMVLFAVLGLIALRSGQGIDMPYSETVVVLEIASSCLIVVLGIPTDILLLLRRGWALGLGYATALATLPSVGVGTYEAWIQYQNLPAGSTPAYGMGVILGGGVALGVRVLLLVLYVIALVKFGGWVRRQQAAEHGF